MAYPPIAASIVTSHKPALFLDHKLYSIDKVESVHTRARLSTLHPNNYNCKCRRSALCALLVVTH